MKIKFAFRFVAAAIAFIMLGFVSIPTYGDSNSYYHYDSQGRSQGNTQRSGNTYYNYGSLR